MKVPTYKKYGLSKKEFDEIKARSSRVSHLIAHDIPLVLGIVIGIALWIYTYKRLNPSGVLETASQIFVFGTIGLICVGIPMLVFKIAEKMYFAYLRKSSEKFRGAAQYDEDKEKFDYWKIRRDESYWKLLDGLSFENEAIAVLRKAGYIIKCAIDDRKIISKDGEDFVLLFSTGQEQIEFLDKIGRSEKAIIISSRPFLPELVKKAKDYKVRLMSIKELTELVRTIKE